MLSAIATSWAVSLAGGRARSCCRVPRRSRQPVLRSGDPEGVLQEMWALLAVYQAICQIAGVGVDAMGIPPERISFPHALQAATATVAASP